MIIRLDRITSLAATLVWLAGCGSKVDQQTAQADSTPPPTADIQVVDINAADYAFQIADTIPGGWVTLRIHNNGQELHHASLIRLEQGKTLSDLAALTSHVLPDWAIPVGGPSAPPPGGTLETTIKLAPGSYAVVCMIPSPDGVPHIAKGMVKPLTVVVAPAAVSPPAAQIAVTLSDYDFHLFPTAHRRQAYGTGRERARPAA